MKNETKKLIESVRLSRVRSHLFPVLHAGGILSNCAYSLKQRDDLPQDIRDLLAECQKAWDEAIAAVPKKWRER